MLAPIRYRVNLIFWNAEARQIKTRGDKLIPLCLAKDSLELAIISRLRRASRGNMNRLCRMKEKRRIASRCHRPLGVIHCHRLDVCQVEASINERNGLPFLWLLPESEMHDKIVHLFVMGVHLVRCLQLLDAVLVNRHIVRPSPRAAARNKEQRGGG